MLSHLNPVMWRAFPIMDCMHSNTEVRKRIFYLRTLTTARAIENQMFAVCCNSCGTAGKTVYGGNSAIIEPFGKTLALGGENEEIITADCDIEMPSDIRSSIPVFRDRRQELY